MGGRKGYAQIDTLPSWMHVVRALELLSLRRPVGGYVWTAY